MKTIWIIVAFVVASFVAGVLVCQHVSKTGTAGITDPPAAQAATTQKPDTALRIGIVPERDIFAQRRRYRVLMDYLETQIDRPIALATVNTYKAILDDFAECEVDGAFLGSMVAVLTMDRQDTRVIAKPQMEGNITTYHGVLFVGPDSPIHSVDELAGRTIAAVRTTTAGDLFAMYTLKQAGLLNATPPPEFVWVGTHDDVLMEVVAGRADAGSVKNLRLDAYERLRGIQMRRLAEGPAVPNNALLLRADVADTLGPAMAHALLTMHESPAGREALEAFGATKFVPCEADEYSAIYDMAATLTDEWPRLGINGTPPKR